MAGVGRGRTPAVRSIEGRVVLVTGATAGIGRRTAERLADAGATVVGCARDELRLQEVRTRRRDLDLRHCDVTDRDQRAALVTGVLADHGRIDVLVNNAALGWEGLVEDMSADDVDRLYATNVVAAVDLTRRVLPGMLARRDGDVVMTSSGAAFVSVPPLTVYCSTKYAIDGFVEGLRRELWTRGMRVHSVNPGPVRTEWLARSAGYEPTEADGRHRLSRGVPPEWVAAAVHRSLTRPWSRTVSVPRVIGLGRLLGVQPLRTAVDVTTGMSAGRLARLGQRVAERRAASTGAPGHS